MTLAHKTLSKTMPSRGMTLLEVVIALFLLGVLMTLGLVAFNGRADDRNLRLAASEIESLAGRARSLSFLQQTPYRINISGPKTISLESPTSIGAEQEESYTTVSTYTSEVELGLRRWGAKDNEWLTYSKKREDSSVFWYFSPTGLCEPVSIRLKENANWILLHMDPLTGRVQEEESYITK